MAFLDKEILKLADGQHENIYIVHGDNKWLITAACSFILPMILSVGTFWFGFYATIATEEYVQKVVTESIEHGPWLSQRETILLRLSHAEKYNAQILKHMDVIKNDIQRIERRLAAQGVITD